MQVIRKSNQESCLVSRTNMRQNLLLREFQQVERRLMQLMQFKLLFWVSKTSSLAHRLRVAREMARKKQIYWGVVWLMDQVEHKTMP